MQSEIKKDIKNITKNKFIEEVLGCCIPGYFGYPKYFVQKGNTSKPISCLYIWAETPCWGYWVEHNGFNSNYNGKYIRINKYNGLYDYIDFEILYYLEYRRQEIISRRREINGG